MKSRLILCTCTLGSSLSCSDFEWLDFDEVDLGVDVRLNAVESNSPVEGGFIAVGEGGMVVRDDGRTWDLGDADLHDIMREYRFSDDEDLWFVVGDAGTIAVGRLPDGDTEIQWLVQESGTSANLYGVDVFDGRVVVVVGDEVVLGGYPTGELGMFQWIAQPLPDYSPYAGWGRLRDVEVEPANQWDDDDFIRVVGLNGRIWRYEAYDDEWYSLDAQTDEDLYDIYQDDWATYICGSGGTLLYCESWANSWGCTSQQTHEFDYVGCHELARLTSERRIRAYDDYVLDWQPRGIDEAWGRVVVGDGGHAGWLSVVVPYAK